MALMAFEIPAGYTPIPIGLTLDQARAYAAARTGELAITGDQLETQVVQLQRWSTALQALGAMYAGVYWDGQEEEPRFGTLLVAAQPLAYGTAFLASRGLAHTLREEKGGGMAAKPFDLPCGPASVFARQIGMPVSGVESETGEELVVPIGEFQAFIPVPSSASAGREEMAVIAFQTPDLDHWETYAGHLTTLLRSIEFDEAPNED